MGKNLAVSTQQSAISISQLAISICPGDSLDGSSAKTLQRITLLRQVQREVPHAKCHALTLEQSAALASSDKLGSSKVSFALGSVSVGVDYESVASPAGADCG